MRRNPPHSRRTIHRGLNGGQTPVPQAPTWQATAAYVALPVFAAVIASYPIAAAIALAALAGTVAGAALQRRYADALDRAIPTPERESAGARDASADVPTFR